MVPSTETLEELTNTDIWSMLVVCIPIGILNGIAGWSFTRLAWKIRQFLNPAPREEPSCLRRIFLPQRAHLAIIGVITGLFGVIAYEQTGVNGVWGTTGGAIPEAIAHGVTWNEALLLFLMKIISFTLATAGGGPGGMLVPSLVAGGFLGLTVGLLVDRGEAFSAACAVVGMGSLFASVMHLPVSGVIIIFELTRSKSVILPVVVANFIASNVAARLPHGEHSFGHLMLEHDPQWEKLGKQDFIETDAQEKKADDVKGLGNISRTSRMILKQWFQADSERLRHAFDAWKTACDERKPSKATTTDLESSKSFGNSAKNNFWQKVRESLCLSSDVEIIRASFTAWVTFTKLRESLRFTLRAWMTPTSQETLRAAFTAWLIRWSQGTTRSSDLDELCNDEWYEEDDLCFDKIEDLCSGPHISSTMTSLHLLPGEGDSEQETTSQVDAAIDQELGERGDVDKVIEVCGLINERDPLVAG
jgi:hypothetical protein